MLRYLRIMVKRYLPRKLYARSLLIVVMPILLLQAIVTWVFYERYFADEIIIRSNSLAREVSAMQFFRHNLEDKPDSLEYFADIFEWQSIELLNKSEYICKNPNTLLAKSIAQHLQHRLAKHSNNLCVTEKKDIIIIKIVWKRYHQSDEIMVIKTKQKRFLNSKWHFLLVWMFAASLILMIISILFLKNQIRPIRKLANAVVAFGKGNTNIVYSPSGASEVREAGQAFLEMRDRIQRHVEQRTMILAGISHDLRTMLTRLKLGISLLDDKQAASELELDVKMMQNILDSYLNFAKGCIQENLHLIFINTIIEDSVYHYKDKNFTLHLEETNHIELDLRPIAIMRAMNNIMSNAAKYANDIVITTYNYAQEIIIEIEDNGKGIKKENLENVFKPFFQENTARTRNIQEGVGLGLPITRDIIRIHGGDIILSQSKKYGGLKVEIKLPK